MQEWLGGEGEASTLSDWDISRDAPYFGFEIPGAPGKYFYVWLDAPIGYYASFKNLAEKKGIDFDAWVGPHSTAEQYHFIGKDILYFHTLFWPAMLRFSGYRTPTNVFAHGFLTVDGAKMSKSRGTFITAQSYIDTGMNPEWLRYYFAAKLNASMEDLDLNLDDFIARVNSDLIGKYVNIASRAAGFLVKRFEGKVDEAALAHPLLEQLREAAPQVAQLYEAREYSKALRLVMELTATVNAFVDTEKPWELAKDEAKRGALHAACSVSLEAFRLLTVYLKPVVPSMAAGVERFLNVGPLDWRAIDKQLSAASPVQPVPSRYPKPLPFRQRRKPIRCRRAAQLHRCAQPLVAPFHFHNHFPMHGMRMLQRIRHRQHRRARHASRDQRIGQQLAVQLTHPRFQLCLQRHAIDRPTTRRGIALVISEPRHLQVLAQNPELPVIAHGKEDRIRTRSNRIVRIDVRMRIPRPHRRLAAHEPVRCMRMQQRQP